MNALDALRLKIRQALSKNLTEAVLGKPQAMSRVLEELKSVFDTVADTGSRMSIAGALQSFRKTRDFRSFLDLKYVCLGITQEIGPERWKLIEDPEVFSLLLNRVDALLPGRTSRDSRDRTSRRFLKCYQGLLSGYFDYNIYSSRASGTGRKNWVFLRAFLHDRLPVIGQASPLPRWVQVLNEHENLLKEDLYERYGAALAQGNFHDLKSACEVLLIPRNSWVWEATVLVRIRAVCSFEDSVFVKHLGHSLDMITSSRGIALSEIMKKQCTAHLLRRYARCASRPVHERLLDAVMAMLGNPWADRAAWDAYIRDEESRAMASSWLKRRLIGDFFRILSEDAAAGGKRGRNWLRFDDKIDDVWVALGPQAFHHTCPEVAEFRRLAGDRILKLENGGRPENNALIMRIGDYVFVELGSSGYSMTVFKNSTLPFDLNKKWVCVGIETSGQHPALSHEQVLKQCMINAGIARC